MQEIVPQYNQNDSNLSAGSAHSNGTGEDPLARIAGITAQPTTPISEQVLYAIHCSSSQ